MGDLINLKAARKARERAAKQESAVANRARFGRPKSEKARDRSLAEKAERTLDQHRRDDDDGSRGS
jgi:hypothetical protein